MLGTDVTTRKRGGFILVRLSDSYFVYFSAFVVYIRHEGSVSELRRIREFSPLRIRGCSFREMMCDKEKGQGTRESTLPREITLRLRRRDRCHDLCCEA